MGSVITILLGLVKVIPILDNWYQAFIVAYTNARIDSMKKENLEAIRACIQKKDQRDLEAAIGNPHPGEPSHDAGAIIVDKPPPGAV